MRWNKSWKQVGVALVAVAWCLLIVSTAGAQSKQSAKQAESLEKAGQGAKAAVQDVLDGLRGLLVGYNSIIDGEAKDNQKAYNKLLSDTKATEKKIDNAKKQGAALQKEADKFFKAWETDLASISSDSLREKSSARMEAARQKYASIGETLGKAREELAPVVQNLNDQILFLGRDLSPEAVADLKDEAAELNRQAAEATEKIRAMLKSATDTQTAADAELEGE